MRFLLLCCLIVVLASPAWAGFRGPSAAVTQVGTVTAASEAPEGTTCVLTGNIIEHLNRDRYTFKDDSGSITVNIPPHVFGALEVTPASKVRITGEIRGKRHPERPDAHVDVRYLEVLE